MRESKKEKRRKEKDLQKKCGVALMIIAIVLILLGLTAGVFPVGILGTLIFIGSIVLIAMASGWGADED